MPAKRFRLASIICLSAMLLGIVGAGSPVSAAAACTDAASAGCWSVPFQPGAESGASEAQFNVPPPATPQESLRFPTAATAVVLPSGVVAYWNGLQNLEDARGPLAADAGGQAASSDTAMLDLTNEGAPLFFVDPTPPAGDDLFCTDQRLAQDGTLVAVGGTHWQTEISTGPVGENGGPRGLAELYGSKQQHTLATQSANATSGSGWGLDENSLNYGRWYPTMITLGNADMFVAGGVSKLLWNSSLLDAIDDDDTDAAPAPVPYNVNQTETRHLDGTVTLNDAAADITLPLFARLHLLPNGSLIYSASGQLWAPAGEAADQMEWGKIRTLDSSNIAGGWTVVGESEFLGQPQSGSFSALLPLQPPYDKAEVLVSGGTIGTSPSTYVGTNLSQKITATKDEDGSWSYTVERAPDLANARWYSTGVTLPNGAVVALNGADVDEVIMPGTESAIRTPEIRDPETGEWTSLAGGGRDRTYHNSAILLADGSVLVGGHAPINQFYGDKGAAASPRGTNNLKDPSFERFFPPYLFDENGDWATRPAIQTSQKHVGAIDPITGLADTSLTVTLGGGAVDKWVLSRLPSNTHITDADSRTVVLPPATPGNGNSVSLTIPSDRNVVPPGFYYLFALSADGVPSVATVVQVANDALDYVGDGVAVPVELPANTPIRASGSAAQPVDLPATSKTTKGALAAPTIVDDARRVALPGAAGRSPSATTTAAALLALAGVGLLAVRRRRGARA